MLHSHELEGVVSVSATPLFFLVLQCVELVKGKVRPITGQKGPYGE